MAHLVGITIYPLKSFDGTDRTNAVVLPSGALEYDRRFALHDAEGGFVNGKRFPRVHGLRSRFDLEIRRLTLDRSDGSGPISFAVDAERAALVAWLAEWFGLPLQLREDEAIGFPDDTDAPGPTVISTGTLEVVADWFPGLSLDEVRRRFRANLEIGGVEPFWEDRLVTRAGATVPITIGGVCFEGVNPCQRCAVPARHPDTGDAISGFQKLFAERRRATLPAWAEASRFNHYYRLAVNTRLAAGHAGGTVTVGDEIRLVS